MYYAGSGRRVPVTDPADQARVARIKRLAGITGPADKSRCAMCGSPDTTDDVLGIHAVESAGAETKNEFYLCRSCEALMLEDFERLRQLGERGTH